MTTLFDPITLGAIHAPNRILMAPLTRGRATRSHVPTPLMGEYYSQRASAGLIIAEATGISQQGLGWPSAPGLWSEEQVAAWKPVVQAVHDAGGIIFAQLCDARKWTGPRTDERLLHEARTARLPAGTGDLPLFDFLDALPPGTEIEYEVARADLAEGRLSRAAAER